MDVIFHEKQEGSLCAQHCLNALLQGEYFSAVDLAQIAQRLDERERALRSEGGTLTHEYQNFIQQPSSNFDDSGFFSIQVIVEALRVWNLELLQYNSQNSIAEQSRQDPTQQSAYICNFRQHWFTIRQLGHQWFNLNSLLSGPELISNTYLSLFITQLQQEGYSIFIVLGELPDCDADQLLKLMPAVQSVKPTLITEVDESEMDDADPQIRALKEESRKYVEAEDASLQKALQLSMEGYYLDDEGMTSPLEAKAGSSSAVNCTPSLEEVREKRLAFLNKLEKNTDTQPASETDSTQAKDELSEEDMLKIAMEMSMQQQT
ncbi:ataxin-3-like [Gigantopelta aegis]|uniref:ataxin-3-like n=1 Tax=Gigantopelta aegis TaxID=1735272 RepID=UPI001B88C213|nr:ataxin-3-like [Gigantopelta aegis]